MAQKTAKMLKMTKSEQKNNRSDILTPDSDSKPKIT